MGWMILLFVVIVLVIVLKAYIGVRSNKAVERFLLPKGSDKEFFEDPKSGKKYDKEAYTAHLNAYVKNFQDAQLQSIYNARNARNDIWNQLLCEAAKEELLRRANAEDADGDAAEEELEEIDEKIAPFFWVEQSTGASIGLTTGEYLQDLFDKYDMAGTGADWDHIAQVFLQDYPKLNGHIQFDSQNDMFCAYGRDAVDVKKFAYVFQAACENHEEAEALFCRAAKEK